MSKVEIIETIAIFVAIGSLWPGWVLRWEHPVWQIFMYVMGIVMVIIMVRRIRRFQKRGWEDDKGSDIDYQ